jgi:hypothetical protein
MTRSGAARSCRATRSSSLAILLLLPKSQITGLTGFLAAIKSVFTVYGGHIAANGTPVLTGAGKVLGYVIAIAVVLALLTSGATWIMGADRAQVLHRSAWPGHLDHDPFLHRHFPGPDQAAAVPPARRAAIPRAWRNADGLDRRRVVHALGDPGIHRVDLPRIRRELVWPARDSQ